MAARARAAEIAAALGKAKQHNDYWMACCPAHEDKKPSLIISNAPNGNVRFKCLASCTEGAVRAALQERGLLDQRGQPRRTGGEKPRVRYETAKGQNIIMPAPADARPPAWNVLRKTEPTALYEYRDADGALNFLVGRWDRVGEKDFRPLVYVANESRGAWHLGAPPSPRPLFGLEELARRSDASVLVVEGEKAALRARLRFPHMVVVTWWGGANNYQTADWSPLAGREVILWPDADEAGKKAMAGIARTLTAARVRSVRTVSLPPHLPEGWDLADDPPGGIDVDALLHAAREQGGGLERFALTAGQLVMTDTPPREYVIEPFLPTHSLSMIYAPRGLGKTWFALSLAAAVSEGKNFFGYVVPNARTVLYIDGEMALADLKERVGKISQCSETFLLLPSEQLYREDRPLNINLPDDQARIVALLDALSQQGRRPEVIIFDNLSSLSGGIDENDNSALDALLLWLIGLRHKGYAIVLVHHAGKNGTQRGASRREDALDTSIELVRPGEDATHHDGAHFVIKFTKTRGKAPQPHELELRLLEHDDKLTWSTAVAGRAGAERDVFRALAEGYSGTQQALAEESGVTGGRISQILKSLRRQGYVESHSLTLTGEGRRRALALFPDLEKRILKQGDLLKDSPI